MNDFGYFDPLDMQVLQAAQERAWLFVAGTPDGTGGAHERFVRLVIALGVLGEAANGERDVARLAAAGYGLWDATRRNGRLAAEAAELAGERPLETIKARQRVRTGNAPARKLRTRA